MVNKNNNDKTFYKRLSILIDQGGFSFYLHHEKASASIAFEPIVVEDIFHQSSLDQFQLKLKDVVDTYAFDQIKLAFANELFSLVPEEFYEEEAKADFLKFNVQLFERDKIEAEFIPAVKAYLLFVPLMNYHNLILEQVEEFEYIHFIQALIADAGAKSVEGKQKLKVFIRQHQLDVIAFDGQAFKLANTFNYDNDFDIIYYILFAIEELKFDQKDMGLYITHHLDEQDWLGVLERYVQHVFCHKEHLAAYII